MTTPDIIFADESVHVGDSVEGVGYEEPRTAVPEDAPKFPPPILDISEDKKQEFLIWLDQWVQDLIFEYTGKQKDWASQEESYRAQPDAPKSKPFTGASNEVVPAIAMAVDPIHARLETGIFKQDPVFQVKPLKKAYVKYGEALTTWINYYQRHRLKLRRVANPRILEMTKLGTMVFKTVYDREESRIKTYDIKNGKWVVETKTECRFKGPRVFGVALGDFMCPALYEDLQLAPIVVERIRTTYNQLKLAQFNKRLANVNELEAFVAKNRTEIETQRIKESGVGDVRQYADDLEIFEVWCDYDINGDGLPENLVATYHKDTRTLLQLRYNWYFHQRKPYTVIPYQVTNNSILGIGICEMVQPLQSALTRWHQMAQDNAYIANIRMFIVKRESGIEEVPRLYAGRCFFVDDPKSDFIPFSAGEIYPSTLNERQNIFGLIEKRTGVSDYLTGRESPIIGSRATATSTLALIQEGTKRVEEVLENIRNGFSEIIENCLYIWIQYGLEDIDELVFGDDETGQLVKEFFQDVNSENVHGALAIDLTATDAAGNRQAMQAMQLQIINVMMQYLEKLLMAGQAAIQAQQTQPELAAMIGDVMGAARKMFKDLLQKYDIRNPEDYLPDLEKYLNGGQSAAGGPGDIAGQLGGAQGQPGLQLPPRAPTGPTVPQPAAPGSGNGLPGGLPFAGLNPGAP